MFLDEPYGWTPIKWCKFRPLRELVAHTFPFRRRPIFLVSMPRSGSSWIGEMLAQAPEAAYLREPLNQAWLREHAGSGNSVTTYIDPDAPLTVYSQPAREAFTGLPLFGSSVVQFPAQWPVTRRNNRQLIVKEVNPLCLEWIIGEYNPKILLLFRHPAAVALSRWRMGWRSIGLEQSHVFHPRLLARYGDSIEYLKTAKGFWEKEGARQGFITKYACDIVRSCDDHLILYYEDMCRDHERQFRRLYEFCGLTMTKSAFSTIRDHSLRGDPSMQSSTFRNSQDMEFSWQHEINRDSLQKIWDFYEKFDLSLYNYDWFAETR